MTEVAKASWSITAAALAISAVLLIPDLAHAQAFNGGGGGLLEPVINWFGANFVGGLIQIGVIAGGVILMFMRMHMTGLAMMIIGSLIVTNYQMLAALL